MELKLYMEESGFAALGTDWNDLLRRSRWDTLFLTLEWQSRWWSCIGASRGSLYLLAARDDNGKLIGIIPLYLTKDEDGQTLHVVGCVEISDYLDLIVEAGQEERVYSAFLDWLAGPNAPAWNTLDLCNQPSASLAHSLLPEMARARGWSAEVFQEDVCPVAPLPGDWEAYLDGLDKKQRHEIRRKLRRMEREAPGCAIRYVSQDGPELDEAVTEFVRLHRLSSDAKQSFMNGEMQAFFHEMAHVIARAGWLQLAFLDIDGQSAATYFCFNYGSDLQIYNSGYDTEIYPQLSPGWVLLAEMIRQAIADGRSRVDFLQGNEDYKYRFGGVDTPVFRTMIYRQRTACE